MTVCPACGASDLRTFYDVDGVPVHSVLLVPTQEEALRYPTGSLRLAICPTCGFITNTAFDPGSNAYSPECESTQGFSPYFRAWLEDLASWLVTSYDVRDKTVLEIGAGQGEFLARVCELGDNWGIGIDPALRADRIPASQRRRLILIDELYDDRHIAIDADVIMCRHTLEHVQPVGEFVRRVRRSIGERDDVVVFFELPDVARVLREAAFWDLYYEHCSYFTLGSLARLFRREGFDVTDLRMDYDDQYILLVARPARAETPAPTFLTEDTPAQLVGLVEQFQVAIAHRMDSLRTAISEVSRRGERTVIWGAGSKGVSLLTTLHLDDEIEYAVDVNPFKQGMYMPLTGQEVVPPSFLASHPPAQVMLMNAVYQGEVRDELESMGLRPELLAL